MTSILIAEDEQRISMFIEKGLRAAGYTTTVVSDGITALDYATALDFDLLILDVGLPRMDGFTVLRQIRLAGATIPVVMVTARDTVGDTVAGLEGGANDYIAKPFRFEELLARVNLRVRESGIPVGTTELRCGALSLDVTTRLASVGGRQVELSPREYALLKAFLENCGQVLSREQLLSRVWGFDFDGASNVVDVYVRYLRNKLGNERFVTIRGAGYRLVEVD